MPAKNPGRRLDRTARTPVSLQEFAYSNLRGAIIDGMMPPGSQLVESDIATRLGISRTPVREAIRRLAEEGLVTLTPRVGARVSDARAGFDHVFEVREALEGLAIRLAVRRATPAQLTQLRTTLARMKRAADKRRISEGIEADALFHRQILRASGNPLLEKTLSSWLDRIQRIRTLGHSDAENVDEAYHEHEAMFAALVGRNEQEAVSQVHAHMEGGRRRLTAILTARGGTQDISYESRQ